MGYTIMYSRQFVKTTTGIIPIALYGSSNVTTYNPKTGREIRERSWNFLPCMSRTLDMCNVPAAQLLQEVHEVYEDAGSEIWKQNGKWVDGPGVIRFFEQGVKYAKTLEEIREVHFAQSLNCSISHYEDFRCIVELQRDVASTEALEEFVADAKTRYQQLQNEGRHPYINIGFWGNEPLNCERSKSVDSHTGPVLAKCRNNYVVRWSDDKQTLECNSKSPEVAHVFQSVDEAKSMLPPQFGPYTFVDAKRALRLKPFVLRVSGGYRNGLFIKKLSGRSLYFTEWADNAKRFHTAAEAQRWFDEYVNTRFAMVPGAEVVKDFPAEQDRKETE